MNFTLHQLYVFQEVVRQKSVTRAAEELFMTQPALSIQLKNFQNQFDIPLTEVIGRQLYITDFGMSIAELAENVLKTAEEIKYKTREYGGLFSGRLRISSASTGKYVIPFFLSPFLQKHNGIDLMLDVTNKIKTVNSLRNNDIDFALVSVVPDDLDVYEEPIIENRLYLVGNKSRYSEDLPFIFREEGSATRLAMDNYLRLGKQRKRLELTSSEAVKQAVIAGLGYSIISLIGMKNELESNEIHILPSKGLPIITSWRLIWLKSKKLSPVAGEFLRFIQEEKAQIVRTNFAWYLGFGADRKRDGLP
jgi:DNA-binding transcriptional LysR family regulator